MLGVPRTHDGSAMSWPTRRLPHRLGIVGEPLYVVGPRRVHGVTPSPLVVVHEGLIGLQASEHWPPGAPRTSPVVQEDQRRGRAPTCVGVKHCTVDVYDALDGVRRSHCWIATGGGDELVECGGVVRHRHGWIEACSLRKAASCSMARADWGSPAEMNTGTITS